MKNLIRSLFLALPLSGAAQSGTLNLSGSIDKLPRSVAKVALRFQDGDNRVADTVTVTAGRFAFSFNLSEPVLAQMTLLSDSVLYERGGSRFKSYSFRLFLEPRTITVRVRDSVQGYQVMGSPTHEDFVVLSRKVAEMEAREEALYEQYQRAERADNQAAMERIRREAERNDSLTRANVYGHFVRTKPQSQLALLALEEYLDDDMSSAEAAPLFASLAPSVRNSPSGKALARKIEIAERTLVGKMAMDFTQKDTLGRPVSLSSFRGKYVLVDFWASWCRPCRQENPNVVKAFQTYKDKNFTVLGVSLDRPNAEDRWLKAIHDDQLTWTHVSDLKYWENEVARMYGVHSIPQNFLIDPQGKIIAKNLRGEELQAKLAELLR